MEEGSLRVDAKVSVRSTGATELKTKTEVKNLNSFRFLQKALAYEIEHQIEVIERGGEVTQETRLFDSREGRTYGMRSKEIAHDYRYFPEPDLLPLVVCDAWVVAVRDSIAYEVPRQIAVLESGGQVKQVTMGWDEDRRRTVLQRSKESSEAYRYFPEPDLPPLELSSAWVESIRATLPELPDAKIGRFIADYGLSQQDAEALTAERPVVDWFEQAVAAYGGSAKEVANCVRS